MFSSWFQKEYEPVVEKRTIQVNGKPIQILKLYGDTDYYRYINGKYQPLGKYWYYEKPSSLSSNSPPSIEYAFDNKVVNLNNNENIYFKKKEGSVPVPSNSALPSENDLKTPTKYNKVSSTLKLNKNPECSMLHFLKNSEYYQLSENKVIFLGKFLDYKVHSSELHDGTRKVQYIFEHNKYVTFDIDNDIKSEYIAFFRKIKDDDPINHPDYNKLLDNANYAIMGNLNFDTNTQYYMYNGHVIYLGKFIKIMPDQKSYEFESRTIIPSNLKILKAVTDSLEKGDVLFFARKNVPPVFDTISRKIYTIAEGDEVEVDGGKRRTRKTTKRLNNSTKIIKTKKSRKRRRNQKKNG
jgi:hypothetical protein